MFKKSLILAAAISCFNIQASNDHFQQKIQEHEHRIDPAQKAIIDSCQKRLSALEEEEKSQYNHTNVCWTGAAIGIIFVTLGAFASEGKVIGSGAAFTIGSGGLGLVSMTNENEKARMRMEERERLYRQINSVQQNK
jgi:hypothetical protein